jgi:hypothetical protein
MQAIGRFAAVYRTNSGAIKLPSGKYFRALPEGFADILVVLPTGKAAFIEVKTGDNRPSPAQERFLARMTLLGCQAGIARSVTDALEICGIENKKDKTA